jgi:hypothetical protein
MRAAVAAGLRWDGAVLLRVERGMQRLGAGVAALRSRL